MLVFAQAYYMFRLFYSLLFNHSNNIRRFKGHILACTFLKFSATYFMSHGHNYSSQHYPLERPQTILFPYNESKCHIVTEALQANKRNESVSSTDP
jgi:hypothetical protein